MTRPATRRRLEGEPLDLLGEAIGLMDVEPGRNGAVTFHAELEPRLATPFVRALMRVEARLLLEDADRFEAPGHGRRTERQRSVDAFVILVTSVAKMLSSPDASDHPTTPRKRR